MGSDFFEKAGGFLSGAMKKAETYAENYDSKKTEYMRYAKSLDDERLIKAYKNSSSSPLKSSVLRRELIDRGLIKES